MAEENQTAKSEAVTSDPIRKPSKKVTLHGVNGQINRIGACSIGALKKTVIRIELKLYGGRMVSVDLPIEKTNDLIQIYGKDIGTIIKTGVYVEQLRRKYILVLFDEQDRVRALSSLIDMGHRVAI